MGTVQLIATLAAVLFLIQVVVLTSKNRLHDQQAFTWLMFAIAGVIIAFLLPALNRLAAWIGVSYLPTLIFMLAFFIVLSFLVYHTIVLSDQQEKTKKLVQEVAFLNKKVEELSKSKNNLYEEE